MCVGSSANRSQIFQGTTDRNGLVSFGGIPPEPFVVTAHQGPRGAEQAMRLGTPGGLGLLRTEIQLPATASGPTCLQGSQQLIQPPPTPAPLRPPIGALQRREFCFGALGNQCGQPQGLIPPSALCTNGVCFINGGSWAHDECCARRRGGVMCDVPNPDDGSGICGPEFGKAVRLVLKGMMWARPINFSEVNTTGVVNAGRYCAPSGTLLPGEDAARCCSRTARPLSRLELALAAPAVLLESPLVCR